MCADRLSRPSGVRTTPGDVTAAHLSYELNTDFEASMMSASEITALVGAWQSGAISRDTLLHNFRTGEILPSARTNEQEMELIRKEPAPAIVAMGARAVAAMGASGG